MEFSTKSERVTTAELMMRAYAAVARLASCSEVAAIWRLVGVEVGAQLLRRRGVKIPGLGALVLTAQGVVLGRGSTGSLPASALGLATISRAAGTSREVVAKVVEAVTAAARSRCAGCCELWLRPVGRVVLDGGAVLEVCPEFASDAARAWDSNLAATARKFGGVAKGFRPDHRPASRPASRPPRPSDHKHRRRRMETVSQSIGERMRARLVVRHGPDALCIFARHLESGGGKVDAAFADLGLELSTRESAEIAKVATTARAVQKLVATSGALGLARREAIDATWHELCVDHSRAEDAKVKGVRRDGNALCARIPLGALRRRVRADWHPHVKTAKLNEEDVIRRLLAHLDAKGSPPHVHRTAWRAAAARLSAAFAGTDVEFATWFRHDVWACRRPPVVPAAAWEEPRPPPPVLSTTTSTTVDDDDDDSSMSSSCSRRVEMTLSAAPPPPLPELEWNRLDALCELRRLIYTPPCDLSDVLTRLGTTSSPETLFSVSGLAQRLKRRNRTRGLVECLAETSVAALHADLSRLFGRHAAAWRAAYGHYAPLVFAIPKLRRALLSLEHQKPADFEAFRRLVDSVGLRLSFKQAGDLFRCLAAGDDHLPYVDILKALRFGGMSPLRRSLVETVHSRLCDRCGGSPLHASDLAAHLRSSAAAAAPSRIDVLREFGTSSDVSRNDFLELYDYLSPLTDGDYDFFCLLRDTWDLADCSNDDDSEALLLAAAAAAHRR